MGAMSPDVNNRAWEMLKTVWRPSIPRLGLRKGFLKLTAPLFSETGLRQEAGAFPSYTMASERQI